VVHARGRCLYDGRARTALALAGWSDGRGSRPGHHHADAGVCRILKSGSDNNRFALRRCPSCRETGVLAPVVGWMLRDSDSDRAALSRVAVPTATISGFLNNTPIVAMLIPQLEARSRAHNRSVSRYLMPLSFAAILGGALTLMGTATNIIASGLLEASGEEPLGFFEITWVGLPIAIVGTITLVILSPIVLPDRRSARGSAEDEGRFPRRPQGR
jgi:di/tricarboxylate transporter